MCSDQKSLNISIRVILALTIPATLLLIAGIPPLVGILGFDEIGTNLVIWCAQAYTLGLFAYALTEVTARAFYAQQNARTPLITIFVTATIFIILAIPLAKWIGAPGIALANSIAFTSQLGLMIWFLNRNYRGFAQAKSTLQRVVPASLAAAGIVLLLNNIIPLNDFGLIIRTLAGVGILSLGGVIVLPFIWPEIKSLQNI